MHALFLSDREGIRSTFCLDAMSLATKILNKEGVFLSKMFMGSIYDEINKKAKNCFKKVVKYKPLSSKKESKEIYIFCKGVLKIWYIEQQSLLIKLWEKIFL